jgi:hypothetical protein
MKTKKPLTAEQKARKAEAQHARRAAKKAAAPELTSAELDERDTFVPPPAKKDAKAPKAKPAPAPAKEPKAAPLSKRAQVQADAEAGKLPSPPDFSAETHAPYRKRLDAIIALVEARDLKGLKAIKMLRPYNSSIVALHRYRDLALTALAAQAE